MKNLLISMIAIVLLTIGFFTSCDSKDSKKEAGVYYTCPMHPEVKKDEPGQCPVCGMDLVKKTGDLDPSDSIHKH